MKKSVIVVVCLLLVGIFGWSIAKANSADIKVHLGAGTIVMDQQELVLTPDEAIMVQEDTVYPVSYTHLLFTSTVFQCSLFICQAG